MTVTVLTEGPFAIRRSSRFTGVRCVCVCPGGVQVRKGEHGPALECMQQATDVLFLPSLWGHGVLYEEVSVSASFLYG